MSDLSKKRIITVATTGRVADEGEQPQCTPAA